MDVPRLYAIADAEAAAPLAVDEAVERLVDAGVDWIQVRAKRLPDRELFRALERLAGRFDLRRRPRLWIDDRVDLALLFPVFGVHLGQRDLPPTAARRLLADDPCRIGHSTHDPTQARAAEEDPAVDLVAFGPIFPTRTKENPDPVVGLEALTQLRRQVSKPLVAIGGIDADNAASVIRAGADAVAVIGGLWRGGPGELQRRVAEVSDCLERALGERRGA